MLKRAHHNDARHGPVGLDDQPRPASARDRIVEGLKRSAPFSSLQRRIIFFNLIGLAMLVAGMTFLTSNRQHLIEVYVDALRKQGEIIAIGIAETASIDEAGQPVFDRVVSANVLSRLAEPTDVRIRLYDSSQRLVADTYYVDHRIPLKDAPVVELPTAMPPPGFIQRIERVYHRLEGYFATQPEIYSESPTAGVSRDEEVLRAVRGQIAHKVRVNRLNEVVISVAMPVIKQSGLLGILQLSTIGGEIDRLVREELREVLEIFFLAAIVSVLLSILLANMIASPIRMLAKSANIVGSGGSRPLNPDKPEIPDLTHRADEIGELSDSLIRMTSALYTRIGAIESFAADVAHEIKNPLTSLRSAVETMHYAHTDEQRQKLLDVIMNDVKRMDRLVTDISNASRLDAELVRERMEAFDLGKLIRVMAGVTEAEGAARGVRVVTTLPDRPFIANGLENRLAQVVTNLLANALSFSPDDGEIRVTGVILPGGELRVSVEDQGPGIPPENLGSIFERFYSERPDGEDFGNHSGLGLSISKQIIEAHGGRIAARNIPDPAGGDAPLGARFVFELPG